MYLEKQIIEKNCLKGLRILVIESKRDERDLLAYILESHGAAVISEATEYDAVRRLMYHPPDVVFASVKVMEQYPLDLQINISPKQAGKEILIIGVAESERAIYPAMAQDLNCHACISKPLDITEVVNLVTTLTGRHERRNYFWT